MDGLFTTRHEEADLFGAGFWVACEHEAGRVLRRMTALDEPQGETRPSRGPLPVAAPR